MLDERPPLHAPSRRLETLPTHGFVRLRTVLAVIPVSKTTWWDGVKSGRYPKPVKLGPRITAWRVPDIRQLIVELDRQS